MENNRYYSMLVSLKYGLLIAWVISISFVRMSEIVGVLGLLLAFIYVLILIYLVKDTRRDFTKKLPIIILQLLITIILVSFSVWSLAEIF
ncbi:hypothetical protein [Cytobacillus sp. IB215665]|uniref:hypothetical protein n=1 Tax=Cytobacillus sp. IB215665 TaxID=3097357 RepID=UPI002A15542A|nr:hypothetical protein [Cytobacillus sp. IB215665]MDX8365871.1 hypothetical protein [Cytobacillus sp. IB215665]